MVAQAVDAHGHGTVQYSTAPLHVTVMGWVTVPNRTVGTRTVCSVVTGDGVWNLATPTAIWHLRLRV